MLRMNSKCSVTIDGDTYHGYRHATDYKVPDSDLEELAEAVNSKCALGGTVRMSSRVCLSSIRVSFALLVAALALETVFLVVWALKSFDRSTGRGDIARCRDSTNAELPLAYGVPDEKYRCTFDSNRPCQTTPTSDRGFSNTTFGQ